MLDCVLKNRNKKENNLKFFLRDHFNTCRIFPVDGSGSNEDARSNECSSRSSVSETGKSSSSPIEINRVPFYNPGQPSRNEIFVGASSLVNIWEARSQQLSSTTQSQSLTDSRRSYGLSLPENSYSSSFSHSLNNTGNIDSCPQSYRTSYEKEREGRCLLQLVTSTPRIRGRQAYVDFLTKILRDRGKELQEISDLYTVSKFSPRGCERLQYMLRIRSLERCIAIQERHGTKSAASNVGVMNMRDIFKMNTGKVNSVVETRISLSPVSSREKNVYKMANKAADKNVFEEKTESVKETIEKSNSAGTQDVYKPEIANKPVLGEAVDYKNGLKKLENKRKATEEGEESTKAMGKAIVKESIETNKTSLSIAEKVNLWNSKDTKNMRITRAKAKNEEKSAKRVTNVEATERNKETRKKEVSSYEEGKSMENEEYRINSQEEETATYVSSEEEKYSLFDEKPWITEKQETSERLCLTLGSPIFLNGWNENEMEDKDYTGESVYYDWVKDLSRPRSHWEDLRKKRELEIMSKDSKKDDIKGMIKERTVSRILTSNIREKIEKVLISRAKRRLQVDSNLVEEDNKESLIECSASYQEKLDENGTLKVDLETVTVSDCFSRCSVRSFEEHEAAVTISLNPNGHENTSSETQICDLREQIKKLQREMIQLQHMVNYCVDFKKSAKLESFSGSVSDSLKRKCVICFEMPVNSLLYRCGHMCTCLKCGHELQWSSRKCPICMAPIIDVVRAFLDS